MTVVNARVLVRRVAAVLALGALLAVILPVATAQAATTYSISGTVSLPSSAPSAWLQGVSVSASADSGYGWNMVNPTTGAYTITGLSAGDYYVQFNAQNYTEVGTGKTVTPNLVNEYYGNSADREGATKVKVSSANVSSVNATLDLGRTISGKVTLPSSVPAAALASVGVSAMVANGGPSRHTRVDAVTGAYTIVGLRPGSYQVTFDPGQYFDADTLTWVQPNVAAEVYNNTHTRANANPVNVSTANATAINATLEAGLTISGKVTLPAGSPKEWYEAIGVSATVPDGVGQYGYTSVDPETGNYSISGLAPGQYTVAFDVRDYHDDVVDAWFSPNLMDEYYPNSRSSAGATKVSLGAGGATGINVTLDRGAMLSGTVSGLDPDVDYGDRRWSVMTASGEVVREANFDTWVNGAASSTSVNSFALGALEPGKYRIMLSQWNGEAWSQQYLITAAGESLFTLTQGQALSGLTFAMRPTTAAVSGTLTTSGFSGYSTQPDMPDYLADVVLYEKLGTSWVRYPHPANGATANGATAYTIPGLGAGTYTVGFEKSQTPYTKNGALAEQWFNGKTSLATANPFTVTAGQAKTGVNGVVAPAPQRSFTTAPAPTISGAVAWGSVLTAKAGTWSPAPTSFAYQWYRNGSAISGATRSQYAVSGTDAGASLTVKVTATKSGYVSATKASASVAIPPVFTAMATPTITGTTAVGSYLYAGAGKWTPTPTSFSYQWFRNGTAISGAKYYRYALTTADVGATVTVKVTGVKSGYLTTTKTSAGKVVTVAFATAPAPTISGAVAWGSVLTAKAGTWSPAPTALTYQWYRNNVAVSGATKSQYIVSGADAGASLTVKATAVKSGYVTTSKASASLAIPPVFTAMATPTITGTAAVGNYVYAGAGTWTPTPTSFSYQWFRNGTVITGAKYYRYALTAADAGATITVKVTGVKSGYLTTTKTSAGKSVS